MPPQWSAPVAKHVVKLGSLSLSRDLINEVDSFSEMLPSLSYVSGSDFSDAVITEISKMADKSIQEIFKETDVDPTEAIQRELGNVKVTSFVF